MPKCIDQVRRAPAAPDDGKRIRQRGTKAEPLRLNRPEIGQEFTNAALEQGKASGIGRRDKSAELDRSGVALGDSISVQGVCLTVTALSEKGFSADVSVRSGAAVGQRPGQPQR